MKNELFRAQSLANGSAKDLTSIEPLNGDYIIYGFGSAGAWVNWYCLSLANSDNISRGNARVGTVRHHPDSSCVYRSYSSE